MPGNHLDPRLLQQVLQTFTAQLEERLQAIIDGLLRLERPDAPHAEVLDGLFRAAHNIKGAARGVGLEASAELAHALEDLFSTLRREGTARRTGLVDLCLDAVSGLRRQVEAEAGGHPTPDDLAELPARLRALAAGAAPAAAVAASQPTVARDAAARSTTVRLPVERLDRIADLAEELQGAKIRVDDHYQASRHQYELATRLRQLWRKMAQRHGQAGGSAGSRAADTLLDRHLLAEGGDLIAELEQMADAMQLGLRTSMAQLRPLAAGLREDARALRMVPADTLLKPLALMVRDLARELGKQAELVLDGERLEMDRAVLDSLRDPLNHLLRNALDHGIETTALRRAAGKPEVGRIRLGLERHGNSVAVEVADDGAGIDLVAVRQRIRTLGLASDEEIAMLPPRALLNYLFRPGFSTRTQVGKVSGRGVGLDVVQVSIEALGGRIALESEIGHGSRFLLTLPLTLASDHGLLVRVAGQVHALPSLNVQRILEVAADDVLDLAGGQAVQVDGEPVPLRDLGALLGRQGGGSEHADPVGVVVIRRGWHRVALRVDHVLGEREMLVKPLEPPLDTVRHVAGGTLGRDGDIILVLDVGDLLDTALSAGDPATSRVVARQAPPSRQAPRILVADDSITTRTLEQGILENAGYRVQAVADGEEAWEALQNGHFDLLISDVEMPALDGFDLTRRLRADAQLANLPVVIVTSLGSEEHRRRGLEVRADAYVVKSDFESTELLEVVRQLL